MPSVAFSIDPRGAEEGARRWERSVRSIQRAAIETQHQMDQLNAAVRALGSVHGAAASSGAQVIALRTANLREEQRVQRALEVDRARAARGLLTLRSTLGGAERASAQMTRAQQRLDAATKAGLVPTSEAARLQRLMADRFTTSAVNSRDLRLNMQRLSRASFDLRRALFAVGAVLGAREIVQANITFERMGNALRAGLGSADRAADALGFLRTEADRLGLDLAVAGDQFSKLAAAARGTALEGAGTRDIFTAIAEASTVLGLSAEQTGGVLVAVQQIISKGTVSAEELRGQLGERLPGAFQLAARSIGVTTAQLGKMLETGSLAAEQLLPRLADELHRTFGSEVERAAHSTQAEINRLNTALFDLKVQLGESGAIDAFRDTVTSVTDALRDPATQRGIEQLGELFKATAEIAVGNLDKLAAVVGALVGLRFGGPIGGLIGGGIGAGLQGLSIAAGRFGPLGGLTDAEVLRQLQEAQRNRGVTGGRSAALSKLFGADPNPAGTLLDELGNRFLFGELGRRGGKPGAGVAAAGTGSPAAREALALRDKQAEKDAKRLQDLQRETQLLHELDRFDRERLQARFALEDALSKAVSPQERTAALEREAAALNDISRREADAAKTTADFTKAQEIFGEALANARTPAEQLADGIDAITAAFDKLKAAGVNVTQAELDKAIDGFKRAQQGVKTFDEAAQEAAGRALQSFSQGFSQAFVDVVTGTKTAGEAFEDFAARAVASILDIIAQMLILKAVSSGLQGLGSTISGQASPTSGIGGFLFALGGSIRPFASGGIVDRPTLGLIGENAPNVREAVIPLTSSNLRELRGSTTVIVNNNVPNTIATQRRTKTPEGELVEVAIAGVADDLARGGKTFRNLKQRSNVLPQPRRQV